VSRERFNLRRALVVSQVALSLVLLAGALLFARSLGNLLTLESGFRQDGLLLAHVDLSRLRSSEAQRSIVYRELLDRLRAAPQVESAAQTFIVPISGFGWNNYVRMPTVQGQEQGKTLSNFNQVSAGYFRTMGTPLLAGRDFDERDNMSSPKVAIVDETFARRLLAGANPIGFRFEVESEAGQEPPVYEIVGLVRDSKYGSLREEFSPTAFVATSQEEQSDPSQTFVLRSGAPLASLNAVVRQAISDVDRRISFRFEAFLTKVRQSLLRERLMATLSSFFGLLAALLATLGLYGTLSYTVAQRRTEIGIRMALGADRRRVVRMILGEASVLLVLGLALGTAATLAAGSATEALLFGLKPSDPLSIAGANLALAIVALGASYLPARRAGTLEPAAVLNEG